MFQFLGGNPSTDLGIGKGSKIKQHELLSHREDLSHTPWVLSRVLGNSSGVFPRGSAFPGGIQKRTSWGCWVATPQNGHCAGVRMHLGQRLQGDHLGQNPMSITTGLRVIPSPRRGQVGWVSREDHGSKMRGDEWWAPMLQTLAVDSSRPRVTSRLGMTPLLLRDYDLNVSPQIPVLTS